MFKKLVPRKTKKPPEAVSTLVKLRETLEMLEKKETLLQKRVSSEVKKASEFAKLKNKKAAIQCLKKKNMYDAQLELVGNFQLKVHDQIIMLEGARATTDTVDALRTGALAMKKIQSSLNVDDIDQALEETSETMESMRQIGEALSTPFGAAAEFDEDELEAELEELEELEAQELLDLPRSISTSTVTGVKSPVRAMLPPEQLDVQELSRLQAEMAI